MGDEPVTLAAIQALLKKQTRDILESLEKIYNPKLKLTLTEEVKSHVPDKYENQSRNVSHDSLELIDDTNHVDLPDEEKQLKEDSDGGFALTSSTSNSSTYDKPNMPEIAHSERNNANLEVEDPILTEFLPDATPSCLGKQQDGLIANITRGDFSLKQKTAVSSNDLNNSTITMGNMESQHNFVLLGHQLPGENCFKLPYAYSRILFDRGKRSIVIRSCARGSFQFYLVKFFKRSVLMDAQSRSILFTKHIVYKINLRDWSEFDGDSFGFGRVNSLQRPRGKKDISLCYLITPNKPRLTVLLLKSGCISTLDYNFFASLTEFEHQFQSRVIGTTATLSAPGMQFLDDTGATEKEFMSEDPSIDVMVELEQSFNGSSVNGDLKSDENCTAEQELPIKEIEQFADSTEINEFSNSKFAKSESSTSLKSSSERVFCDTVTIVKRDLFNLKEWVIKVARQYLNFLHCCRELDKGHDLSFAVRSKFKHENFNNLLQMCGEIRVPTTILLVLFKTNELEVSFDVQHKVRQFIGLFKKTVMDFVVAAKKEQKPSNAIFIDILGLDSTVDNLFWKGDVYIWGDEVICENFVRIGAEKACRIRHAAVAIRQGRLFTWEEESGGRLGHGVGTRPSVSYPTSRGQFVSVHVNVHILFLKEVSFLLSYPPLQTGTLFTIAQISSPAFVAFERSLQGSLIMHHCPMLVILTPLFDSYSGRIFGRIFSKTERILWIGGYCLGYVKMTLYGKHKKLFNGESNYANWMVLECLIFGGHVEDCTSMKCRLLDAKIVYEEASQYNSDKERYTNIVTILFKTQFDKAIDAWRYIGDRRLGWWTRFQKRNAVNELTPHMPHMANSRSSFSQEGWTDAGQAAS